MPELAEVEYHRKRWDAGLRKKIVAVKLHPRKRVFRDTNTRLLAHTLAGATLLDSEANGKQMLFRFSQDAWLGIHLGMSGALRTEPADFTPGKHDHLCLLQKRRALVYRDPRMFGRVRFAVGKEAPSWWTCLAPAVTASAFTLKLLRAALQRFRRAPIKALLLRQELFPGIGNWMADEILWQARLDPRIAAGEIDGTQSQLLWRKARSVSRTAMRTIGVDWSDPPRSWLLHERWKKRGRCPRDGASLCREQIAGRTTAWCPSCQPARLIKAPA